MKNKYKSIQFKKQKKNVLLFFFCIQRELNVSIYYSLQKKKIKK